MQAWVIIYAIGAAQALLLALALWRRPANATANRVLAGWTALVGVDLAVKSAYFATAGNQWTLAYAVVGLFPFLHASLFYLYVRTLTTGRSPAARDAPHAAGFAIALVAVWPQLAGTRTWEPPGPWFVLFLFGYALAYVAAALVRITRFRALLRARRADADRQSLRWLGALALSQMLIWVIAALQEVARIPFVDYFLIYGAVALWVFVTGYFSLAQPPVVEAPPQREAAGEPIQREATLAAANAADTDDTRIPEVEARLSTLMSEHALFREPALTIGQLARRSGYPEYLVSTVINRRFGETFWDYINRQRIEATRACLADPADNRTILDIAYACGFTSKSTFNAAFKRQLGETPSAYRRRHAAPSAGVATAARTPPG